MYFHTVYTGAFSLLDLRESLVFAVHSNNGLKLLTYLRLNFCHLNEHKFRHNFNDAINWLCPWGKEPETTLRNLLHCYFYCICRLEPLNDICALKHSLKNGSKENLLKVLPCGAEEISFKINSEILKCIRKTNLKKQIDLVTHYFFLSFLIFSPTMFLVFNFLYTFYVQSIYKVYIKLCMVLCKFGVLCCLILLLLFLIAL